MTLFITLVILVIIGSGFFSGLEAAMFAVSSRVTILKEQQKKGSDYLAQIHEKISRPITAIVIGNNIINIVGSIFVGVIATKEFGSATVGYISAGLTILIIIFGEIIPKTIGENNDEQIALFMAKPLYWATKVLSPIIYLLEFLTDRFVKPKKLVSEQDLVILSDLGHQVGSIEEDERDMIKRVFQLNDISAEDIMTPRTAMYALQKDQTIEAIKNEIYNTPHSRIPVYGDDVDDIVGISHRRELMASLARQTVDSRVGDTIREPLFVSEDMKADDLLVLFQEKHEHIAIVKDEFHGTSGLVTLEDVVELLVGEIVDETDQVEDTRVEALREAQEEIQEVHTSVGDEEATKDN